MTRFWRKTHWKILEHMIYIFIHLCNLERYVYHIEKSFDLLSNFLLCFPCVWYVRKILIRSRQIELKLRWSCWPPLRGLEGGQLFLNIFWSMYRTFIILFPAQRKTLKTPSTYLEHDHKANRKIFRDFWKKSFASEWGFHQNILA